LVQRSRDDECDLWRKGVRSAYDSRRHGKETTDAFRVPISAWIAETRREQMSHYVLFFKDDTFESVAESFSVQAPAITIADALCELARTLRG
jgi:hypothetical protein